MLRPQSNPYDEVVDAVAATLKRFGHRSANVQLYALALANALSQNCGTKVHRELASRTFTLALSRLIGDRNVHKSVKSKAFEFLESWVEEYKNDPSLGLTADTYRQLKSQSIPSLVVAQTLDLDIPPPSKPQKREITQADRQREEEELQMALALSLSDSVNISDKKPASSLPQTQYVQQPILEQPRTSAPAHTTAATVSRVRGLYDFVPSEAGELAFRKGDIITVLESAYKDWWRGSLRGIVGIFPINYVEIVPDPTEEELRKEAEDEAKVFAEAKNVEKLLSLLTENDGNRDLAEDEQLQTLYHSAIAVRPKLVSLIEKYSQKRDELITLNDRFLKARRDYDALMEASVAQFSRPEAPMHYYQPKVAPRPSEYQHQPQIYQSSEPFPYGGPTDFIQERPSNSLPFSPQTYDQPKPSWPVSNAADYRDPPYRAATPTLVSSDPHKPAGRTENHPPRVSPGVGDYYRKVPRDKVEDELFLPRNG